MVETVRSLRSIALPAYGPTALGSVGTGAVLPVVVLTARSLGAEVSVAAFLLSLIWVAQLAADLPAGAVASRIGERGALMLACGIEALGMVGCATAGNLVVLGVSLGLLGVASSVFGLARQAYLTDAVPIHLRARALSTLGGVNRIGIFVGPFVGALVVAHWGDRGVRRRVRVISGGAAVRAPGPGRDIRIRTATEYAAPLGRGCSPNIGAPCSPSGSACFHRLGAPAESR